MANPFDLSSYDYYDYQYEECLTGSGTMSRAAASHRKERLTVSLSPSSAEFLRRFSAEGNLPVSTVVENMVENSKRALELAQLNAGVSAFYDSLPDAVLQEQAPWGETGAAGLAEVFESEIKPATPEKAQGGK